MTVVALIQARMSSRRFPGKVLAPFRGRPLIDHVVDATRAVHGIDHVVVLTSRDATDDPLALYVAQRGVETFRGVLEDVFGRFREYLAATRPERFLRVSADSPLLDPIILGRLISHPKAESADVVTTVYPRTFPRGMNGELVRTKTFMEIDPADLTADEREHVTPYFYHHPTRFLIESVTASDPRPDLSYAIDTVDDLRRLESSDIPSAGSFR